MTIIESVKKSERMLIVYHIRPDGDCLGAGFALKRIAEKEGKKVDFVTDSPLPAQYSFIDGFDSLNDIKFQDYDLGIAVDCADDLRLGKYLQKFKKCKVTFNIDHHRTNNRFAVFNIVAPDKSSTCELLYDLIKDDGVIDKDAAKMLSECGCVMADTEGLIDYAMSIGSVRAAVCMSEQNVRSYKVSFRAKDVDVAAAAGTFGGGGHKLAAGCVVNGHYEDVVDKVVKAVSDGMTE